ncbi:MAG TPA: oligosaccharide flippase family protein [Paralcaligenes sp.]
MIAKPSAIIRKILPKNQFARGVSILVGGTAGSQLLAICAAPVVTRLFSPADFGVLAVYAGLLGLFTVIASLRYELAILLPEDNQEAADTATLSLLVVVAVSVLSIIIVFLGDESIPTLLGVPVLSHYFWLLPIGLLLVGIYQVFNYWALRTKNFTVITGARLKQSLTSIAIQLLGYPLGPVALLISHAAGQGMGVFSLGKAALRYPQFRHVSFSGIVAAAKRYRQFPIYSTWAGLLNSGGNQLPSLMFAALFSPAAAGLYALTSRVLNMPMIMIGSAIGNVFFTNLAEAHREKRLPQLVAAVQEKLAHVVMPPTLVLLIAGPQLFAFVFGESWREAGIFSQWMAPWLYVVFITSPLGALFDVLERQQQELIFETALFITRIATIAVGALIGDLITTVALFSLGSMLCWLGYLLWITVSSGNPARSLIKPTVTALAWGALCMTPLALSVWLPLNRNLWFYGLALTGVLVGMRLYFSFYKEQP